MRDHHPFRGSFQRDLVARLGLQIKAVELEVGGPALAGILVAKHHRAAILADGLNELHIPAAIGHGDGAGERADFVREGMDAYRNSLRRRLILLVFVLPVVAVAVVIWAINFS